MGEVVARLVVTSEGEVVLSDVTVETCWRIRAAMDVFLAGLCEESPHEGPVSHY